MKTGGGQISSLLTFSNVRKQILWEIDLLHLNFLFYFLKNGLIVEYFKTFENEKT
jgi:hypothetical protein